MADMAPHSLEAEEAVIGSILINSRIFEDIYAFLKPDDFFSLRHALIWTAMERLQRRGELIEYITVVEELRTMERLTEVGGAAYVGTLLASAGTSMHADAYGQIVRRTALRRRLIEAAAQINALALDEEQDVQAVLDKAEKVVLKVTEQSDERPPDIAVSSFMDTYEEIMGIRDGKAPDTLSTGLPSLDKCLRRRGLNRSALYLVAADTSGGKSMLAQNIATNIMLAGDKVYWHSLEMDEDSIHTRLLGRLSGIPIDRLDMGEIQPHEEGKLQVAHSKGLTLTQNFILDTETGANLAYSLRAIKRAYREHKIKAAFVDYPALLDDSDLVDLGDRPKRLGYMARCYLSLARELKIPIVVLAQQARDNRGDRTGVKGIAESYEMTQHCSGFLYIQNAEDTDEFSLTKTKKVTIGKQRSGKRGVVELVFHEATQYVTDQGHLPTWNDAPANEDNFEDMWK